MQEGVYSNIEKPDDWVVPVQGSDTRSLHRRSAPQNPIKPHMLYNIARKGCFVRLHGDPHPTTASCLISLLWQG